MPDDAAVNCGTPSEPAQDDVSKSLPVPKLSIHEEMAKRDQIIADNRALMASLFGEAIPALCYKSM
jgi:hypothetical protein